ncbi:hypothetical protein FFE93_006705 [Yersinia sp. KBS0713]|uniref:hypothetical protein n=1 Tax=Yersinia TaxID=629 RepID=UPI00110DDA8D|nr:MULTISPECIES: hypothetical protein [Yersinia]QDW32770.1 hypothetical protein FFE93_006705 [Yersinia sp. KBS0713]
MMENSPISTQKINLDGVPNANGGMNYTYHPTDGNKKITLSSEPHNNILILSADITPNKLHFENIGTERSPTIKITFNGNRSGDYLIINQSHDLRLPRFGLPMNPRFGSQTNIEVGGVSLPIPNIHTALRQNLQPLFPDSLPRGSTNNTEGKNSYTFNLGDGGRMMTLPLGSDNNTLIFGAGITPDMLHFENISTSTFYPKTKITVKNSPSGDHLIINESYSSKAYFHNPLKNIEIGGVSLQMQDIHTALRQNLQPEFPNLIPLDFTKIGKDEYSYTFNLGDGARELNLTPQSRHNTLILGAGITTDKLHFEYIGTKHYPKIKITFNGNRSGDYLVINESLGSESTTRNLLRNIKVDGVSLPMRSIHTALRQNLQPLFPDSPPRGLTKNTKGENSYTFNLGDGGRMITLIPGTRNNTLIFGAGITPDMLHFESIGSVVYPKTKITLKNSPSGDHLIINESHNSKAYFYNSLKNIEVGGVNLPMQDIHTALRQNLQPKFPNLIPLDVTKIGKDEYSYTFNLGDGARELNLTPQSRHNTLILDARITPDKLHFERVVTDSLLKTKITFNGNRSGDCLIINESLGSESTTRNLLRNIKVGGVSLPMRSIHRALRQNLQPLFPDSPPRGLTKNTKGENSYTFNLGDGGRLIKLPSGSHHNTLTLGAGITLDKLHFESIGSVVRPKTKITFKNSPSGDYLVINENLKSTSSGCNSLKNIEVNGQILVMTDIRKALGQGLQPTFPDKNATAKEATNITTGMDADDGNIFRDNKGNGDKLLNFNEFSRVEGVKNTLKEESTTKQDAYTSPELTPTTSDAIASFGAENELQSTSCYGNPAVTVRPVVPLITAGV